MRIKSTVLNVQVVPLEDSEDFTYELVSPGGVRCSLYPIEISEFVVEHLPDGGEFQMVLITDEHTDVEYNPFGKEAEELRKGIEEVVRDHGLNTVEDGVCDIVFTLRKLLDEVDARDSLHYLAKAMNRKADQSNGKED